MRVQTFGLETVGLILLPAYAVHRHWIADELLAPLRWGFERFDVLGIFICVIIVGSLLSLGTGAPLKVLSKFWIVVILSSVIGATFGVLTGTVLKMSPVITLLGIVVPLTAGGITAGALPLAAALADLHQSSRAAELAMLLPAVVLGNLLAVMVGGLLSPWSLGNKRTLPAPKTVPFSRRSPPEHRRFALLLLLGLIALAAFYVLGAMSARFLKIPSPLAILFLAFLVHLLLPHPVQITQIIIWLYRCCIRLFLYPLLFAVGLFLTPWQTLMDGLRWDMLAVAVVTIVMLAVSGAWLARFARLTAVEGALMGLTRAAMGGSGDIAILSAARRMDLMPFAQISTRLGGALTLAVTLAIITLLGR